MTWWLRRAGGSAHHRKDRCAVRVGRTEPGRLDGATRHAYARKPGDGLASERILHYFLRRAFAEVGVDEMIDDVLRHGQALAPDLVLFEAFALAGPLVAELLGVPSVAHMFGPLPPHEAVEHANDAVSPIWRLYGRNVPGWAGMYHHLTIQICPPMLETAQVPTGETLHLRPVPLPIRAREATSRPMV